MGECSQPACEEGFGAHNGVHFGQPRVPVTCQGGSRLCNTLLTLSPTSNGARFSQILLDHPFVPVWMTGGYTGRTTVIIEPPRRWVCRSLHVQVVSCRDLQQGLALAHSFHNVQLVEFEVSDRVQQRRVPLCLCLCLFLHRTDPSINNCDPRLRLQNHGPAN